jgi:hypothetical protein
MLAELDARDHAMNTVLLTPISTSANVDSPVNDAAPAVTTAIKQESTPINGVSPVKHADSKAVMTAAAAAQPTYSPPTTQPSKRKHRKHAVSFEKQDIDSEFSVNNPASRHSFVKRDDHNVVDTTLLFHIILPRLVPSSPPPNVRSHEDFLLRRSNFRAALDLFFPNRPMRDERGNLTVY